MDETVGSEQVILAAFVDDTNVPIAVRVLLSVKHFVRRP